MNSVGYVDLMKLCIALLFALAATGLAQDGHTPPAGSRAKLLALSSPRPDYPDALRAQHKGGTGMFLLHVDIDTGLVTSVDVRKSTGVPQLDEKSLAAFRRWKFKPHSVPKAGVKIPITFDPSAQIPILGTRN
jgi:periplasmic protein TonB